MPLGLQYAFLGPADEPQDFTAANITSTSTTLTWSPPTTPNGIITAYILIYGRNTVIISGSSQSYTVHSLNENTRFVFSIHARTSVRHAGPAASITVRTAEDGKIMKFYS